MFHWCPEETAAVIAAGSAAALGLVWVKARWYILLAWLRAKLGLVDKRHCCVTMHVPLNRCGPRQEGERLLTEADVAESYDTTRKADRIFYIAKKRDVPPDRVISTLAPLSDGLEPVFGPYTRRYRNAEGVIVTPRLPDIDLDEEGLVEWQLRVATGEQVVRLEDITPVPCCADGHKGCRGDDPFVANGGICLCGNVDGLHVLRTSCPPKEKP